MLGFLIALIAGYLVPQLDKPVARPVIKSLSKFMDFEEVETRLISFVAAFIAAALISTILGTGSALGMIVGTLLGYFAMRIWAAIQTYVKGNDEEDEA